MLDQVLGSPDPVKWTQTTNHCTIPLQAKPEVVSTAQPGNPSSSPASPSPHPLTVWLRLSSSLCSPSHILSNHKLSGWKEHTFVISLFPRIRGPAELSQVLRLRSQEDAPCISQVWGFPGPDPCLQAPWGHQRNSFSYLCRTEVAGFLKTLRDYPQSPEATHRALPQGSPNLVTEISSQQNGSHLS